MVKIIFGNGESVEWNEGNLPDSLSIHFDAPQKQPVPDEISADHLEGLCNMLMWTLSQLVHHHPEVLAIDQQKRYLESIRFARERAEWLRTGKHS